VVPLIKVRILNIVETLHLHRFVESINHAVDESALLAGSVSPAKEDHALATDEDPLLVPALHHVHQLLRCVVFNVLFVHYGSHGNLRLFFEFLLQFIAINRVLRYLILVDVLSLYLFNCIILTIS
jgi:hypothetical protein